MNKTTSPFSVAKIAAGFILLAVFVSPRAWAETINLGGVGSMTPLVRLLGAEYAKKNPGTEINVFHPPMGTGGGMRAMSAGKIDIVLSGRPAKPEEGGQSRPWLQTPLVLATHEGKSKGFSSAELAAVYLGHKTGWDDDKPIRLILRGEHESETKVLRTLSPAVDAAVGEALKRPGMPLAGNDLEALELLGKISGSLGTTNLGLIRVTEARLTLLPIDGVLPSAASVETGKTRLLRQFYLVLPNAPNRAALAFADWLASPAALAIARKYEYLPLK